MIIDVILGNTVDTLIWISELRENGADHIIVIDYDGINEFDERIGILYMSPIYAREYMKKFDTFNFYKSFYVYPGMQGSMSSLFKKDKK